MVKLKDNTLTKTEINSIYSKIIDINNKIEKMKKFKIKRKIINQETILLQENINKLIEEKKGLSKILESKKGHFRKNCLGKIVDYSGRSVITVEPRYNLNQCGLPKKIVEKSKIK
jgi:DNA-directed RNA polymerase subunit beta'